MSNNIKIRNKNGGKREGAGRPKKPLSEHILNGNPGKRALKKITVANDDEKTEKKSKNKSVYVPEYFNEQQTKILKSVISYLRKMQSFEVVPFDKIEKYCVCKSRWMEAEAIIQAMRDSERDKGGGLVILVKGAPVISPFVLAAEKYLVLSENLWRPIQEIVNQTALKSIDDNPNKDIEDLFSK